MNIDRNGYPSIQQLTDQLIGANKESASNKIYSGTPFNEILSQKSNESKEALHFSRHASQRLSERDITLSNDQLNRLSEGSTKAADKGINESLVLLDNLAFIVNTKNNTVITAMTQNSSEDNVFTNIDGAVIA